MLYIRKRKQNTFLTKTFCEKHERKVNMHKVSRSKPAHFFFLALAGVTLLAANTCSAWDGAGETWTCGNCKTTNYKWQMSCTNCGTSQ